MTIRHFALGSAAAMALTGLLAASPAFAFTHHPATPEEIQQTDALNAQALSNAQGSQTAPQTAPMTTAAGTVTTAPAAAMEATPPPAMASTTPLKSMATTPALTNAAVQDADGMQVGMVKDVVSGADGKPSIVDVALSDNSKTVAISAGELSFDSANNILVASLTKDEIKALPDANQ